MGPEQDLNNAVSALANAVAAQHVAVTAQLQTLADALSNTKKPDTTLSDAVQLAIANIQHITSTVSTDVAALTAAVPAATTVPPPAPIAPIVDVNPDVTPPAVVVPEITAPDATPPGRQPPL